MTPAISFSSVRKTFGEITALNGVDFTAPAGSVTVLLGPNGAGKTTTVRLTTGAMIPQISGWDNLQFAATIFGADESEARRAAEQFGIAHALSQDVGGYSTGMRTRLALARAVLHDPEVLMLDEPTAGAGRGRTIVMCTHLLHEAEGIADQVVLLEAGEVRASGPPRALARRYMPDPIVIIDAEDRSMLRLISELDGVLAIREEGAYHITLDSADRIPDLVIELVKRGVRPTRVEPLEPTLEDLYFEMQRAHRETG